MLTLLLLLSTVTALQAQDEVPAATSTTAITNVGVVTAPGQLIENATVLIRDGLIQEVGTNVTVPAGVNRIDGADTLRVYAGFIDGFSHVGVKDAPDSDEDVEDRGDPQPHLAGITPERAVQDFLDPGDRSVRNLRDQGFTAAHVAPKGRMLPGTSAVVLLGGDDPAAMILRNDHAMFAQFESASGMFPSNTMAVIAQFRQLFGEAERRQAIESRYANNPAGMQRPSHDPMHRALFPVLSGDLPVYFYVDDALALHRARALQQELGFNATLVGLAQSFDAVDVLAASGAPLVLTLDLPEKADEDEELPSYDPDLRTRTQADTEAEEENLKARLRSVQQQYVETASLLHSEGLQFAFTTREASAGDLLDNIRRIVDAGLPADEALTALTTRPAQMLGVDQQLGTVESGKIANLIVASGDIFDENTDINMVFVDGKQFDVTATPEEGEEVDPTGRWNLTVRSPQGNVDATLELSGTPDDLSGTIEVQMGPSEEISLTDVDLRGNILTFSFDSGDLGTIDARLTLTETDADGTLTIPQVGGVPVSGTRADPDRTTR